MPELKTYTVDIIRKWLLHNAVSAGLSNRIISPSRAWAIVNNPYVRDDDVVLSAIFEQDAVIAYTSAFPELIDDKRYWWFSSLWCSPEYRGQGFGLVLVGNMAELYGTEYCIDRWGAQDTVEIFNYLGHNTVYTTRYICGYTRYRNSIKGRFVSYLRAIQTSIHSLLLKGRVEDYGLRYIANIDDATYKFIVSHSQSDYCIHTQEFLNWTLHYPFAISAPLLSRVSDILPFSASETRLSQFFAVQVAYQSSIIGFYILKLKDESLHVLFLYYNDEYKLKVFASIRDHVRQMHITQWVTEHQELALYLRKQIGLPKFRETAISFSYPPQLPEPKSGFVQYGEGDCFTL